MADDLTTGGTVLPITRWGTPVMHAPTRAVTDFDDDLRTLARDMFATMHAAQGVGLAATQVGVDLSMLCSNAQTMTTWCRPAWSATPR